MADLQVQNFLLALATFMATRASVPFGDVSPFGLFVGLMDESASTLVAAGNAKAAASLLTVYGGSVPTVPTPTASIQCKTIGLVGDDASAYAQATKLHGSLLDAGGAPLRMTPINGFRINAVLGLQLPTLISRDENQRAEVIFNFDCPFVAGSGFVAA